MKKTFTIMIIVVLVLAVLYLWYKNKKSKNNESGEQLNSNYNTEYGSSDSDDEKIQRELDEQNQLKAFDLVSSDYAETLTEEENEEYKELKTKYYSLTGRTDGKNYDVDTLRMLVDEAEETELKAREIEIMFPEFLNPGSIEIKKKNFNTVAKLDVLQNNLQQMKTRAEKAGKAFYEDIINGTKWYYSSAKKANYFHKDLANAWNADNMKELIAIVSDAKNLNVTSDPTLFAEKVKIVVNDTFKAQPKISVPVYPAKATDDQVSNGRYKGNSNRKEYALNGQSIATVLNGINREWFKARENASGVNYGEQVANVYAGL